MTEFILLEVNGEKGVSIVPLDDTDGAASVKVIARAPALAKLIDLAEDHYIAEIVADQKAASTAAKNRTGSAEVALTRLDPPHQRPQPLTSAHLLRFFGSAEDEPGADSPDSDAPTTDEPASDQPVVVPAPDHTERHDKWESAPEGDEPPPEDETPLAQPSTD